MRSLGPKGIAAPVARYSHGIEVPASWRRLRTSGQLGLQADGQIPEGAEAQASICFDNIHAILQEGCMDVKDICHICAYVTDRAHMAGYMQARDGFLESVKVLPTSTLLIVSGFTRPEFMVEVEVWAAAP